MVAIHNTGLICAHCHVEVEAARPMDQVLDQLPTSDLPSNPPIRAGEQKLYRFDSPHLPAQSKNTINASRPTKSTTRLPLSPALAASDSPQLLTLVLLFFVGQALVVWAFFQHNVQALGVGLVTSISAVGLALQSVNRTEMIRRSVERRIQPTPDKTRRPRLRTAANAAQRQDR